MKRLRLSYLILKMAAIMVIMAALALIWPEPTAESFLGMVREGE